VITGVLAVNQALERGQNWTERNKTLLHQPPSKTTIIVLLGLPVQGARSLKSSIYNPSNVG
jgi:hypothetical protein